MRLIPSRHWVKESIPAFLCCETSPWASLWVRFYVWLCPECKQEYASLKQVWDELDQWQVDLPTGGLEDQFTQNFREKFPSAFQDEKEPAPARAGDILLRLVYSSIILVIGAAIFISQKELGIGSSLHPVTARAQETQAASLTQVPTTQTSPTNQDSTYLADAGNTPEKYIPRERGLNSSNRQNSGVLSGEDAALERGVQIFTTSTGPASFPVSQSRSSLTRMKRTVAINYVPVTGFETLQAAEEDRSY